MTNQKCRHNISESKTQMSIQDRQQQLMQTPEFQNAMREWEPRLNRLGSTSRERLERILDLGIAEMTAYSDPMIQRDYMDPKCISEENEEMDRILSTLDLLIILAEGGQTLNAGILARYAWLYQHSSDSALKEKAKLTIDRLIQLSRRYLYTPPTLLTQLPQSDNKRTMTNVDTWSDSINTTVRETIGPHQEQRHQFNGVDLDALSHSVYDLIDRNPGQVLFLEYSIPSHNVKSMTPSEYKTKYQDYRSQYGNAETYLILIKHRELEYDFKMETFSSSQNPDNEPEILAMAFGYAFRGFNLVTISRRKRGLHIQEDEIKM